MFDAFVAWLMLGGTPQHADRTAVVIDGWSGHEPHHLVKLRQSITHHRIWKKLSSVTALPLRRFGLNRQ